MTCDISGLNIEKLSYCGFIEFDEILMVCGVVVGISQENAVVYS